MKNLIVLIVFLLSTPANLISQSSEFSRVHVPNNNYKHDFEPSLGLHSVIYLEDADVLLGVTEYFLMHSFDQGQNWYSTNPILDEISVIKLKQTNTIEVTLLSYSNGKYKAQKSIDFGFIWETIYEFETGIEVKDFTKTFGGDFLFATNKGVIKITEQGNVQQFLLPKVKPNVFNITSVNDVIYYSTDQSFFVTDIYFSNIKEVEKLSGLSNLEIIDNLYSDLFLIRHDGMVYLVESEFKITSVNLPVDSFDRIELDDRIILYADKVYVSMDKGKTWISSKEDLTYSFYSKLFGSKLIISERDNNSGKFRVYYNGFFENNSKMANLYAINKYAYVSAPAQARDYLVLGTNLGGMLRSDDGGGIWREMSNSSYNRNIYGPYVTTYPDNRIFISPGFAFSDDDGESWESVQRIISSMAWFHDYHVTTKNMISWNSDSTILFIYNDFNSFKYIHNDLPYKDRYFPQFDPSGGIWVISNKGDLFKYNSNNELWESVYNFQEKVYRLFIDDKDRMFVFCRNALYVSLDHHMNFQRYSFNDIAQNESYFIDFLIADDILYFSSIIRQNRRDIRKVISFSLNDFYFSEIFSIPGINIGSNIFTSLSFIDGYLYVGGNNGLYRSNEKLADIYNSEIKTQKFSQITNHQQYKNEIQLTAYPNPANSKALIGYKLFEHSNVQLAIYNLLGQQMERLVNENQMPGTYEYRMTGENLSSGIYFAVLSVNGQIYSRKIVLLK